MMRTLIRRSLLRILALIKKEILTILMDKKSRAVLFAPIIVQCIIFGYGASYHWRVCLMLSIIRVMTV